MPVFILIITILYIILSWQKLNWAFLILVFSLPSYLIRFNLFHIPFTLLEIMFFVYFYFWFFENYEKLFKNIKLKLNAFRKKEKSPILNYPFSFAIILFVLSSFIAVAIADFSNSAMGIYKAYFIEAVFIFILSFDFIKKEGKEKIIFALASSSLLLSLFALWQRFNESFWLGGGERVSSIFPYPNALGLFLGPIIILIYFQIINYIKKEKKEWIKIIFLVITFTTSFLAIYFAKSDGALIAVLASLFFFSLFISRRFLIGFLVLGLLAIIIIFSQNTLRTYVLDKIQLKDFSGEVRKQQWKETWKMMTSSPHLFIFGTGLSNYQKEIKPFHQDGIFFNKDRDPDFRRKIVIFDEKYKAEHWRPVEIYMYPHNILLNFWTELGLLGLISFLALITQYFYFGFKFIKKNKVFALGLMAIMLEIIIHGTVDVPYFKNDLSFLFWIFVSFMAIEWVKKDFSLKEKK